MVKYVSSKLNSNSRRETKNTRFIFWVSVWKQYFSYIKLINKQKNALNSLYTKLFDSFWKNLFDCNRFSWTRSFWFLLFTSLISMNMKIMLIAFPFIRSMRQRGRCSTLQHYSISYCEIGHICWWKSVYLLWYYYVWWDLLYPGVI